ncbi:PAS domain-containing hybrid sensor histidine kinase/response regulator [Sphingomonas astaxanthinifaciens]|uniref:histidine kinase n=1 Tax=Sphingomonas astaxanthinifaciens DSM 22298 TaxID=1123267 RepID=A0ABQ5Z5B7_9SPHN|nr:PAS domain-containing sensor histidine kinase [Sphingomonas astaxanthinifaciens]GLR47918.1 hybrid sensor histidine kinase/response regulator [Sphingomonas astaxanthinifaciens DSM 22298]
MDRVDQQRAAEGFDFSRVLSIADALPMPLALVDHDERYLFCNRSLAEFFEVSRSAILGKTVRELLGEAAYRVRKDLLKAALGGERQWFAASFDHPTRGPIALQTEYLPQFVGGVVTGVVIIVQDVTEQRVAERAMRESEARFRRIANSAPVIMWVTRLDRHREFVNDAYLDFTGIGPDEVNSHRWESWIHPEDLERIVAESRAGEATRKPFTLEARYRRADGEYRWLRSVSSPRFGPDGELVGFIGAAFDVTPAKLGEFQLKAEVEARTAALSASESRFRAVFDTALEMISLLTVEGDYLEVNRTALEAMGCTAEEIVGRKAWELPPVAGNPEAEATIRSLIAAGAAGLTSQAEVNVTIAGTTQTHVTSIKPVLGDDGKPVYLVGEARDVTELRGAQEQLRQSQKMEALGQLTGGIAHDFNNLLTVVVGGLDLITKRTTDPKLERYARNALEAAERGARLTAQLLAFSRVQRLEVRPTYVAPLIENMRPLLRNVLGPGIEKRFSLDEERMPVLADPTQLELAVLNLAINARDAMPGGGLLTFRTRKVVIETDPELEPGDYIELSIADTGTGMPPEVVERAFEPFFTTKDVGHGTGLGLSMVYGVARQSGGTARIESRPGEGTTVLLYFRRSEAGTETAEPVAQRTDDQGPAAAKGRVLVVDDDPDVRGFIVASLEDQGYSVREAADGAAGLAEYRAGAPDLVILDYLMPGMSGADVALNIRASRPDQPILFVSGYSETDAIRAAAPDAPLLAKPFRSDALGAAVRKLLVGA